ncbi:MAG: tol-pal system protein YbgF [Deltaproteobacteria bacterium]|nr:tol-pal system protein YbgF [Deltaproteobacteria bacterium]
MKNAAVLFIALIFACTGCATKEDLRRSEGHLGMKLATLQKDLSKLATIQEDLSKLTTLQEDISKLQEAVGRNSEFIKSSRKDQADAGADIIDLRDSIQKLRGTTESLKVQVASLESKTKSKDLSNNLEDISNRLTRLEQYMNMVKEKETKEKSKEGGESAAAKEETATDKETAYSNAYSIFKDGRYDEAKEAFRNFLKSFPNSEYSDNAQFWIGECDYFEGKYEEAIVEYERVIQIYPKGNKVPNALLKQALSFLKLDDKSSAKLLLQRVIKDYPNTTSANVARKKLVDIK